MRDFSDSALNHGIIATQYRHIMKYVPYLKEITSRLTIVIDLQTLASKSRNLANCELVKSGRKALSVTKCVKLAPTNEQFY